LCRPVSYVEGSFGPGCHESTNRGVELLDERQSVGHQLAHRQVTGDERSDKRLD
jgi:hypothetical protein